VFINKHETKIFMERKTIMKNQRIKKIISFIIISVMIMGFGVTQTNAESMEKSLEFQNISEKEILALYNSKREPGDWLKELPKLEDVIIPNENGIDYSPMEHFYPENMTDEEIGEVIERIANGENVIFGDGSSYDIRELFSQYLNEIDNSGNVNLEDSLNHDISELFSQYLNEIDNSLQWSGLNANATHQWLTARGLTILGNQHSSIRNRISNARQSQILLGSDWPDEHETSDFNNSHFYYYPYGITTGTNFMWETTNTAKHRVIYWYDRAVLLYNTSMTNATNRTLAFNYLGRAIHYLSDIGAPVHTGERAPRHPITNAIELVSLAAQAVEHLTWEGDANNSKQNYAVSTGGFYGIYTSSPLSAIIDSNARISAGYYGASRQITKKVLPPFYWSSIQNSLQETQRDVAGLLYKFYIDTGNFRFD
jgi:hypothetical protein